MANVARRIAGDALRLGRAVSVVGVDAHPTPLVPRRRPIFSAATTKIGLLGPVSFPCEGVSLILGRFLSSDAGKTFVETAASRSDHGEPPNGSGEADSSDDGVATDSPPPPPSREEELEAQVKDLKDQLLRSLAEQDNTRRIAKRDVDAAKAYAVTSFAKSLLETSDNLSRALEAVPPEYRSDTENHPVLATLYEGIRMTDEQLTKAFAKNGLTKFGEVGQTFDPNLHEALFEYPDPEKEVGTVGQVMKTGFLLNKRVIRPAEVGVVKKP